MATSLQDRIEADREAKHAEDRNLFDQFDGLDQANLNEAIAAMATDIREAVVGKKESTAAYNEVIKSTTHRLGIALDVRTERKSKEATTGNMSDDETVHRVLAAAS
jgi:hypothetical protein